MRSVFSHVVFLTTFGICTYTHVAKVEKERCRSFSDNSLQQLRMTTHCLNDGSGYEVSAEFKSKPSLIERVV